MLADTEPGILDAYVPRMLLGRLATAPDQLVRTQDGTVVFADVSGFTRLSERLARAGNEGAEHLVDTINSCFSTLLAEAYAEGASLLKFGGDALLLWFEGEAHTSRACAAAHAMRHRLRAIGRIRVGIAGVVLRMSVGVHAGRYPMFLVGGSHREFLIAGPATNTVVEMEALASSGQILLSAETAALLSAGCLGSAHGPGVLLTRPPATRPWEAESDPDKPSDEAIASCLSTALRAHVLAGPVAPEHRMSTVSFLQFGRFDVLIEEAGLDSAAQALDELVGCAQEACDRYGVCFLGSDIATHGGKLLFSSGAPRSFGDDEERMLLAVRHVIDADLALPVRAGVTRGNVFTGDVGPPHRRTYVAMGNVVNLAARLTAKAPYGHLYATPEVLERSRTSFEVSALEPFLVKGKTRPVDARDVGSPVRAATPTTVGRRLPLIGRNREVAFLRSALAAAKRGSGSLVELIGETGSGKSRLLAEVREMAGDMRFVHCTCEAYTRETPYAAWRGPLRALLELSWDEAGDVVLAKLEQQLRSYAPELLPWMPLLAIAVDVDSDPTTEVRELAAEARAAKLHEVVLRFLSRALVVPTLVELEHAHLMDAASATLVEALAAELESSAWLVLVSRREAPGGLVLDGVPHNRIEVQPLSGDELQQLAEATPESAQIPPHVVELAVERAGGSPEFLLDLLASAAAGNREALPTSVGAAAMARVDALEAPDRVIVSRASVLGLSFDPERLVDVLPTSTRAPDEDSWERLSGVFAVDPERFMRFKRPALQQAAYESLPFKLRRALHAAVAERLERDGERGAEPDPAVLSHHFALAGDNARAYRYAMQAAQRATERFSHADAARLYQRAIDATRAGGPAAYRGAAEPPARAWEQLGDSLRCIGEPEAAAHAFTEARKRVEGDPVAQARLCHRHAQVAQRSDSLTAAVRWLTRGLRALDGCDDSEATAWRARLYAYLGAMRNRQGRWEEAVSLCRRVIADAEAVGEVEALARACFHLDWALVAVGRAGEATHSARALEIYRMLRNPEEEATVLNNLGMFAYWQGQWDDAIELYRQAGRCSERAGKPADAAYTDCNVGEILSDQGHFDPATAHLERARRVWTATHEGEGVAFIGLMLGRLAVRDGRYEEGMPLLEAGIADLRRYGVDGDALFGQALVAEAESFAGDPARALSVAAEVLAADDRNVPLLARVRGIALARLGRLADACDALSGALAAARERGADYEIVATVQVMEALGCAAPADLRERDDLAAQMRIERLPTPQLSGSVPVASEGDRTVPSAR